MPNFSKRGTIGRLRPGAKVSELFLELPKGSVANALRFDAQGRLFAADYSGHNIFVIVPKEKTAKVFFHDASFHQPNDLTIARDGSVFASDPSFKNKSGRIWRVRQGKGLPLVSDRKMGATNGLDLSPDERTLFVSEGREIWSYLLAGDRLIDAKLIRKFPDGEVDGLRMDQTGNIYAARILKGEIAILSAKGDLIETVKLRGAEPTNLAFGGTDGRTVYVTQRKGGRLETFRAKAPGREWDLRNGR